MTCKDCECGQAAGDEYGYANEAVDNPAAVMRFARRICLMAAKEIEMALSDETIPEEVYPEMAVSLIAETIAQVSFVGNLVCATCNISKGDFQKYTESTYRDLMADVMASKNSPSGTSIN